MKRATGPRGALLTAAASPGHLTARFPRLRPQHLVTDLGTGQMVTLAVKAIYDDGSFLWSNPRAFLIPSKANKRIENGELKELVAFEA